MRYVVTATMCVVRTPGSEEPQRYLDRGAILPPQVPADNIAMLLDRGLISPLDETPAPAHQDPDGDSQSTVTQTGDDPVLPPPTPADPHSSGSGQQEPPGGGQNGEAGKTPAAK